MDNFLNSTFFRNSFGLIVLVFIWFIFSIVGLRGVTIQKSIKEIRQEAGLSLLTLGLMVISILAIVAFFYKSQAAPTPHPS